MDEDGYGCFLAIIMLVFAVPIALYNGWHFWGGYQDRDIYEMGWHGFWFFFWGSFFNGFARG